MDEEAGGGLAVDVSAEVSLPRGVLREQNIGSVEVEVHTALPSKFFGHRPVGI